jgi:adenylylsulfate kinase
VSYTGEEMFRYLVFFLCLWMTSEAKTVFWFTGLPCAGKTTIAENICKQFPDFAHLDGDVIRKTLNADLGFSPEDRQKNLERIVHLALSQTADTILVTTISPLEVHRKKVSDLITNGGAQFFTVYVKTDLKTCVQRDVKGMYAKALNGEIENFTGVSSDYEAPLSPDLVFETDKETLLEIVMRFESFYVSR